MKRERLSPDLDDDECSPQLVEENGSGTTTGHEKYSDGYNSDSDYDSLFDEGESPAAHLEVFDRPAQRSPPSIPGMYFDPTVLIPMNIAEHLWEECMRTYFRNSDVNQVMLFERSRRSMSCGFDVISNSGAEKSCPTSRETRKSGLPEFLLDLLDTLKGLLKDVLPADVHALLFPSDNEGHQARQAILNHYRPGEGITPHVDLLKRYGDGIIGISLHSGTVMDFAKVSSTVQPTVLLNGPSANSQDYSPKSCSLYLPERSIFVLTGEARYKWTHGIARRSEDLVEGPNGGSPDLLPRGERLSITFRWLLPGADVVGD